MTSTIQQFIDYLNAHDLDGIRSLGTPDAQINLGGILMDFTTEYPDHLKEAFQSFPDMHFTGYVVLGDDDDDDKVYWKNLTYTGTHTGAPFGFGPYPKIEATGIKCFTENQELVAVVKHGKIVSAELYSLEKDALIGPPHFYVQIGGTLDQARKE